MAAVVLYLDIQQDAQQQWKMQDLLEPRMIFIWPILHHVAQVAHLKGLWQRLSLLVKGLIVATFADYPNV